MAESLRLGAFEVDSFLAAGGMAQVWSGIHAERGMPVAIKVLDDERSRRSRFLEAFRTEVRAVACLNHPAIVTVFDHGVVPDHIADATDGKIGAGSPYLVMERMPGASLSDICGCIEWPVVESLLRSILEALAHAHARGVIHRDLKPGNVLLEHDVQHSLSKASAKLTDFGISHALGGGEDAWSDRRGVGTPGYMAPEQAHGRWRDYGPWTDLYAFGRLAIALTRGNSTELDGISIPHEFGSWVERLLHPNPAMRYRRAADAAFALAQMGPPDTASEDTIPAALRIATKSIAETLPTAASPAKQRSDSTRTTRITVPENLVELEDEAVRIARRQVEPLREHWRTHSDDLTPPHLAGAGLGLYGLRTVPIVDRERERDVLWSALRSVETRSGVQLVCLRGPSGCGKSRLAQWLCERAHETGVGAVYHGSYSASRNLADGLGRMLGRFFRCTGLRRSDVLDRVSVHLRQVGMTDPDDWLAVTELIAPSADDQAGRVIRFESDAERFHLLHRYLAISSQLRVAVVWLDDVQWGAEALAFIGRVMAEPIANTRILFVCTAREESLAEQPEEMKALDELLLGERAISLSIGPLEPLDRQTLVRHLLGLEEGLAARVEDLSAGNPLFAVQLVGEWVQRGVLESAEGGFRLRSGVDVELPDDLHQVWAARIDRVVQRRASGDLVALELSAVLGGDINASEWRAACNRAGVEPSSDLIDELLELKLIHSSVAGPSIGWSFVHGMLRESLERRSREAGRWTTHNRVCAEIVEQRGGAQAEERTGRFLLAAGELDRAAMLLSSAAERRCKFGDFREARLLLAQSDEALDRVKAPVDDVRRVEALVLWGDCLRGEGRLDEADRWAHKAVELGRTTGHLVSVAEALILRSGVARYRGQLARAWRRAREAEIVANSLGLPKLLGNCFKEQGWILCSRGDLERSHDHFEKGIELLSPLDAQADLASCFNGQAVVAIQRGQHDEARSHLEQALELHRIIGSRTHAALTESSLADVERMTGDLDSAEQLYRGALQSLEASGYGQRSYCEMNLGLLLIDRKRFEEAAAHFSRALRALEAQGVEAAVGAVRAMMLPCLVARDAFDEVDEAIEDAVKRLTVSRMSDVDVARPAELAGKMLMELGEPQRAKRCFELALSQWQLLGRDTEAEELRTKLTELLIAP